MHDIDLSIINLNKIIKPNLTIVDALSIRTKAVFGKSYNLGGIIAGTNSVDIDKFCCKLMNVNYKNVKYIRKASKMGSGNIRIIGDKLEPIPFSLEKPLFKRKIFSIFFWAMHSIDYVYSRLFPQKTLIPLFNWIIGLRPKIIKSKCTKCMMCVKVCPVGAISLVKNEIKIDRKKCMEVRCLKCVEVCPVGAIQIKRGLKQ